MRFPFVISLNHRFAKDERGDTAVIFGLMSFSLVALMGLALDYSRALDQQSAMQEAIDTAVLATSNAPVSDKISIATNFFNANFTDRIAPATPTFTQDSAGDVSGTATSRVTMPFASLARLSSVNLDITAAATPDMTTTAGTPGGVPCIYVLDPAASNALFMDSNSNLDAKTCEVNVRSNSAQAMYEVSSSKVTFKKVMVRGGAHLGSGLKIADSPYKVQQYSDVYGDPYVAAVTDVINLITVGACTAANTDKTWTGSIAPGTFCGKTEFKNAKFQGGLYIIASSAASTGALKMSGSLNGDAGVSFYLADNTTKFTGYSGSEGSSLKAPTSGVTSGLLFFENPNDGNSNYSYTFSSVNKQNWTGLIYLPSVNLTLNSLSQWSGFNVSIAVNQLKMISLSSIIQPYQWMPWNATQPIALHGDQIIKVTQGYIIQ